MTWESNYLAHYGISGQRWHVRRFQDENGNYTAAGRKRYGIGESEGGSRKQDRQFNRDMRKLGKLQDRTNIELQKQNAEKYDRRAQKAMKVGKVAGTVAAVGLGGAAGLKGINQLLKNKASAQRKSLIDQADNVIRKADADVHNIWSAAEYTPGKGYSEEVWKQVDKVTENALAKDKELMDQAEVIKQNFNKGSSIRQNISKAAQIIGATAAVVAGASYGTAAYSKVQARLARQRITDIGHDKAVQKCREQYQAMLSKYANTPYSDLLKKEVAQYKKDHPNSELSDKEIARNLR